MDPYEEYLARLISQKREEGLIPDLGPDAEAVLGDMVTQTLGIFDGVPTGEAVAALQKLRDLLRQMEEVSGTESGQ